MNFTPLARRYFTSVNRSMTEKAAETEQSQRDTLKSLLLEASATEMGKRHQFSSIATAEEFSAKVPLTEYEQIRADVLRMINGEPDILWPGICRRYAQSSGTSGGQSKFIPLTHRSLKRCHYRGGSDVVASYLATHPDSRLFAGKSFILGGSYATSLKHDSRCHVGDLSANLIDCINPIANFFRVPGKSVALMDDWTKKLPALVNATLKANVTNISGVPSWFLTVIQRVMEAARADELHEVWPGLEVFFHGGIAFGPYREQYDRLIDPSRMNYMETYNASEGFFALQDDPADRSMLLLMDVDVFYEFIPVAENGDPQPKALHAWEVKKGETYALVITSSNGLWRYRIGDTVTVTSVNPLKIKIAGRTKSFINAFGEELMVHNADTAIEFAAKLTKADVADYTAAPVYAEGSRKGRHQWFIEFNTMPENLIDFAVTLDKRLCEVNSDYQAKRSGDIFLSPPEIIALPAGTFDRFLSATGRLGGQRKVPRLRNDREVADAIIALLSGKQP